MRRFLAVLAVVLAGPAPAPAAPDGPGPDGAALFARCAACHLPDGAGVPGTYPPLKDQVARYVRAPEGREYMVTVVTHGLTGRLEVAGMAYQGFMPAQTLTDAEAAAVLNHVAGVIAGSPASPPPSAFTADEVAAIRARHPTAAARDSRALRPEALAAGHRADYGAPAMPGVADPRRAWRNYVLNCQGCHRPDGAGDGASAPALAGHVAVFTGVAGGREYQSRVPGVATSPLSDTDTAELLNWTLWRFDAGHVAAGFAPYAAAEVRAWRRAPLRTEAPVVRAKLLARAGR